MAQILITGKDWTERALLRAQLIEEGLDVEAYEDVRTVVDSLWGSREMPSLVIVDLFASEKPVEDIATLSHWAKLLPIWVLAGHGTTGADILAGQGFEKVLFRPLDLGKLVQEIKERLAS
jgi:DNA-binding NtrC family response regulator